MVKQELVRRMLLQQRLRKPRWPPKRQKLHRELRKLLLKLPLEERRQWTQVQMAPGAERMERAEQVEQVEQVRKVEQKVPLVLPRRRRPPPPKLQQLLQKKVMVEVV